VCKIAANTQVSQTVLSQAFSSFTQVAARTLWRASTQDLERS
jgi:hypothetical protein